MSSYIKSSEYEKLSTMEHHAVFDDESFTDLSTMDETILMSASSSVSIDSINSGHNYIQSNHLQNNFLTTPKMQMYDHYQDYAYLNDDRAFDEENMNVVLRNDHPFPISRPPPKHRDWIYGVVFILHFVGILLLSLIEQGSLQDSIINYKRAGSWSSIIMIITLIGSFLGAILSFAIGTQMFRGMIISGCIVLAMVLKICLGLILLIMKSEYSFLGVLFLVFACIDSSWYSQARDNAGFTSALVQVVIDTTKLYGLSFFVLCSTIIFFQTCILLWWGAFFIGLLSTISVSYVFPLVVLLMLSLYWITQVFHGLVAFIIGGCILWTFEAQAQQQREHEYESGLQTKLLLYTQCALTTSFGSICKAALLSGLSQTTLSLDHWVNRRPQLQISTLSLRGLASCFLTTSVLTVAQRTHRLSFCLMALYGRALGPTAMDCYNTHPEALETCIEDASSFILNSSVSSTAAVIAIAFGLVAERGGGYSWSLFFIVCFYLAHCGVSLSVHIYCSGIDALIAAAAISPIRFAEQYQIVFLRFLRTSETALR